MADEQNNDTTNAHWEKTSINLPNFKNYLLNKKIPDYEGIWDVDDYRIGITKEKKKYVGFIIEAGNKSWKQNEIKLKFTKGNDGDSLLYYTGSKSTEEYKSVEFIGNNYLQAGGYMLKRAFPKFKKR